MTLHELNLIVEQGPYIYLTIPRKTPPRGDKVRLFGQYGPLGKLCTVKETDDGYNVVAVFDTQKILDSINKEFPVGQS
jgi:hypothetical protein